MTSELFKTRYADVFTGDERWRGVDVSGGLTFEWDAGSTYVQNPPYFEGMTKQPKAVAEVVDARILGLFGNSITTDHISPAGNIRANSPAGKYLLDHGVEQKDFNQYGTRRGNHEVMMRGTFANIRIKNQMVKDESGNAVEGGLHDPPAVGRTDVHLRRRHALPDGRRAARRLRGQGIRHRLVPRLGRQGHEPARHPRRHRRESFERIHRSNLVGMGVVPLVFEDDTSWQSLGLKGDEQVTIRGLSADLKPRQRLTAEIASADGTVRKVPLVCRIDTLDELEYFRSGGILHYVLRQLAA